MGRELLGFIWAIGAGEKNSRSQRQHKPRPQYLMDSRADDSAGTTKRRTLLFYAVRFPDPTRAPSPRQLPTDHDHAVPTREYQSDQSSLLLLGCHRPCCPKQNRSELTSRNVFPCAARRRSVDARTVLAGKGSLRRAKGAPLTAVRRSGRKATRRAAPAGTLPHLHQKKRPASSCGGKPAWLQKNLSDSKRY